MLKVSTAEGLMEWLNTDAVFTVEQVAKLLSISRGSAYEGVRTGQIPSIRVGRTIRIPRRALERMMESPEFKDASS